MFVAWERCHEPIRCLLWVEYQIPPDMKPTVKTYSYESNDWWLMFHHIILEISSVRYPSYFLPWWFGEISKMIWMVVDNFQRLRLAEATKRLMSWRCSRRWLWRVGAMVVVPSTSQHQAITIHPTPSTINIYWASFDSDSPTAKRSFVAGLSKALKLQDVSNRWLVIQCLLVLHTPLSGGSANQWFRFPARQIFKKCWKNFQETELDWWKPWVSCHLF